MKKFKEFASKLAANVPRKLTRLPRGGDVKNPFHKGTSGIKKDVEGAIKKQAGALGALNIPGTGATLTGGATFALTGDPVTSAIVGGATSATKTTASAKLAQAMLRRKKALDYLKDRVKRPVGVREAFLRYYK